MAAFHYSAVKTTGADEKGLIEADSERHARQILRERGLIPTVVSPVKNGRATKATNKLSGQALALMTRQLATLLAAGIPAEEALLGVSEQTEQAKPKQLILGVRGKVLEGYSLAQAFAEYPRAFPSLYCASVAAGEQTGKLDLVLEKLADYTENQQKNRQKVQQALIYPTLMVFVSTAIISFLLAFVVPKIIAVFDNSGQALPLMTRVLIHLSTFMKVGGLYMVIATILLIIGAKQLIKTPHFRLRWDRLLLSLPVVSYLIKSINSARYIHTFSILFASGVGVLETMNVSAALITNQVMRQAFDLATHRVKEGTSIHQTLKDTGFLGPMAVHLIASGERSGELASMMARAAAHLDNEVNRHVDTGLTLLEPAIILLMGAVVLFIVLATLLPIFSMEQLVL